MGIESDKNRVLQAERDLIWAIQDLDERKHLLSDVEVDDKLARIYSERAKLFEEREKFVKKHPGESIPGQPATTLPGYVISTNEVDKPIGIDLSYLRKTMPGKLTSSKPSQDDLGQTQPDSFNKTVAKATQVAFEGNLRDRRIKRDSKDIRPDLSKGIITTLQNGEIISSELRGRIHDSVNLVLKAQGIATGNPATNAAIEHELVTLLHLESRKLLIDHLNSTLNPYSSTKNPNENTPVTVTVPTVIQMKDNMRDPYDRPYPPAPAPVQFSWRNVRKWYEVREILKTGVTIDEKLQTAYNDASAPAAVAETKRARVQQLRALGFTVNDPNNPPDTKLGDIADRLTDPTFNLDSPKGRQFMQNLNIPDGPKSRLKNLIESTQKTQRDVNARKKWTTDYHARLDGPEGKELQKASTDYKHLLERKETLTGITIDSSVDSLLAAGSASQATLTAPPGKLDEKVISDRIGNTIQTAAREGEDPVHVTTRVDNTKSVVEPTLRALKNDAKGNQSANTVLAGWISNRVNRNILNNVNILTHLDRVEVTSVIEITTIREFYDSLETRFEKELKSNDTQRINSAYTHKATLASLGSTVYAIAIKEGVDEDNAKTLATNLMGCDPNNLSAANIGDKIKEKAEGLDISSDVQKKLTEAGRISLVTSKSLSAKKYDPLNQAAQEFQQTAKESKEYLPYSDLSLRLGRELANIYDQKEHKNDLKEDKTTDPINAAFNRINKQARQEMHFILGKFDGDIKLQEDSKDNKDNIAYQLSKHYWEHGKLDKETIVNCFGTANEQIQDDKAGELLKKLADPQGKLKINYSSQREYKISKRSEKGPITNNREPKLRQLWEDISSKIPQNRTALGISTAAEAAGYDSAKAKAIGQEIARMEHVEMRPDAEIVAALIDAFPSTDPVVKTAVLSCFDYEKFDTLIDAYKEAFAASTQNGRQATVALALSNVVKSTILHANPHNEAQAQQVANDFIDLEDHGYLKKGEMPDIDDCIDEHGNDLGAPLSNKIDINVRAAYAIAIGKIAGQEAVTTYQTAMGANPNLKNMREVAAVSAATALSEGLSEDLSLEIGKQMAQHYADFKGVMDEKRMKTLMDDAFAKFPPVPPLADNVKNAKKEAIVRSTKAAAGLTQRGTAHAGTTVATISTPTLPQTLPEKIRCQAKGLALAYLCASGDDPDKNTTEIGNALAVTSSGFKASEQQAKSIGARMAASISASHSIFTGFARVLNAPGASIFTTANLQGPADGTVNNPHTEIIRNISVALTISNNNITPAHRDAIAEATDKSIQKAASKHGADVKSIATAGSIAASTTAAALEGNLTVEQAKLLGQSFAEIKHDLTYQRDDLAMVMEISYAAAKTKDLTTDDVGGLRAHFQTLENSIKVADRPKIGTAITDARNFVDSKLGVPPHGHHGPFPNLLQEAITRFNADKSPQNLANLNELVRTIIDGADRQANHTLPRVSGSAEALIEAKRSEAATEAAFRIAQTPGLPPSTLKIARDLADSYAERARRAAEDNTTIRPNLTPKVDRVTVRKLAKTAGVSGFAMAKGIIAGKEAETRGETPAQRAKAATEETAKIMGANDEDIKAAGRKAQLSVEQKLTPRDGGGLTGLELADHRPDVAKSVAGVSTYFIPKLVGLPQTNQTLAQDVSQSVGSTAAYHKRVLADGADLEDPRYKKKVGENHSEVEVLAGLNKVQKKGEDFQHKTNKDLPAPAPTTMASDPVDESIIDIDKLDDSTIKYWDEKAGRLVERRIDECDEFRGELAALKTCLGAEGQSLLNLEVFREAARQFNAKYPKAPQFEDLSKIKKLSNGKHEVPFKNLSVNQIKNYLQLVTTVAKDPSLRQVNDTTLRTAPAPGTS